MRPKSILLFIAPLLTLSAHSVAVEIPLDSLSPVRIGYIDLQRVFDTYPEKSFAEGDLLREIEKRKRDLSRRQTDINTLHQQIAADQAALTQAQTGAAVMVPPNAVPEATPPAPPPAVPLVKSTSTVSASSATVAVEPYPTEDPLYGLPGHETSRAASPSGATLPGVAAGSGQPRPSAFPMLDLLASATGPALLTPEAMSMLQERITRNQKVLDRSMADFRTFRLNAIEDMKALQNQKTYGVMSKIYAVMESLARDEGITVVLDKSYVLYGEDTVDLSDRLVSRLQAEEPQ